MLTLQAVTKHFMRGTANEVCALDNIDLDVRRGDFVTVIGSNGAGKSTMIKAIAGFVVPDEGHITFEGRDITHTPPYRRAAVIARIAQDPNENTCAGMTIEENLAMAERRGQRAACGAPSTARRASASRPRSRQSAWDWSNGCHRGPDFSPAGSGRPWRC